MSGAESANTRYYRAAEVAQILRCSEWWVKEQARNRRIPYAWIGGSYLFTEEHIAEIIRRFERQPLDAGPAVPGPRQLTERTSSVENARSGARLTARPPRRARTAHTGHVADVA